MMLKLQGNALHTSCIIYKKGVNLILEFGPVFYLKANTFVEKFGERYRKFNEVCSQVIKKKKKEN